MNYYTIILLLLSIVCTNCSKQRIEDASNLLAEADSLVMSEPVRTLELLDSIKPSVLSDDQVMQWCLLYGKISISLQIAMPNSTYFERAWDYCEKQEPLLCPLIGLYLGKAYMNERVEESAMTVYSKSLDLALVNNDMSLSGHIAQAIGELNELLYRYEVAKSNYLQAADCFRAVSERNNESIALAKAGKMLAFSDSRELSIEYLQKAEATFDNRKASDRELSILKELAGVIYLWCGEFDLSERYLRRSLDLSDKKSASAYLALAYVYMERRLWDEVDIYLKEAETHNPNDKIRNELLYAYSYYYKKRGNYEMALSYLEEYVDKTETTTASISNLNVIESNYRSNLAFKLDKLIKNRKKTVVYGWMTVVALAVVALLSFYWVRKKMKKHDELYQNVREQLNEKSIQLDKYIAELKENQKLLLAIQSYKEKVELMGDLDEQLREKQFSMLREAKIADYLKKLSNDVKPNMIGSILTKDNWDDIKKLLESTFPKLIDKVNSSNLTRTEVRLCYISVFNLGTGSEAILLGSSIDAINKCRQRVRRKFAISNRNVKLCDYLTSL